MADADGRDVDTNFQQKKNSLLGELSGRMQPSQGYKDRRDDDMVDNSFPPPPPVFQTYAAQLSGKDEEDDLPPPPLSTQTGQCFSCSEEVESGGCTALGRTYHQECFRCFNCKTVIDGKLFTEEDQPFCGNCSKNEDKICDICNRSIDGDCLTSNGKSFHSNCMKCAVCGDSLKGTYFTSMGKLICEKDYKETQKTCSDCKEAISGPYYTLDNDKVVCEKDYKKSLGNCGRCGLIVEGQILKVSGGFFHPDCFTCVVCKKSLVEVPFTKGDDGEVYCSEDYKRRHAATCSACSEHIVPKKGETSAPRLRALDKDFHPECFKCEDCSLVLDSRVSGAECYPVDNRPFCAKCSRNRQT